MGEHRRPARGGGRGQDLQEMLLPAIECTPDLGNSESSTADAGQFTRIRRTCEAPLLSVSRRLEVSFVVGLGRF
jgi:hypothetical protein